MPKRGINSNIYYRPFPGLSIKNLIPCMVVISHRGACPHYELSRYPDASQHGCKQCREIITYALLRFICLVYIRQITVCNALRFIGIVTEIGNEVIVDRFDLVPVTFKIFYKLRGFPDRGGAVSEADILY